LYEIWIDYCSAESRSMTIDLDDVRIQNFAAWETTAGWLPDSRNWKYQANVLLSAGSHTVSLKRHADIPAIHRIAFVPIAEASDRADADSRFRVHYSSQFDPALGSEYAEVPKRERVLVCIIAQTRAHQLTWSRFKRYVLDELGADLAVCIGLDDGYSYSNPFWQHASYRWGIREYDDYFEALESLKGFMVDRPSGGWPNWRPLLDVGTDWLGGIKGKREQPGSGAIQIFFRAILLHKILSEGLLEKYDRFIIARSDGFWAVPHPPLSLLSPNYIWVPDGEHYLGVCDRHIILSQSHLPRSINLHERILMDPATLALEIKAMLQVPCPGIWQPGVWNAERYFALHLSNNGLLESVWTFPYVMLLAPV
jgi:hypothetical protein